MLLADEVEDNYRDYAEKYERHRRAEVDAAVAALQVLNVDRDRPVQVPVEHEVRKEVVVPYPHDLEDADGDHSRLKHREHDGEVGAERAAAVDNGSLLYLEGDALDEADEHKYRKASAEAEVDDGYRPRGVKLEGVGGLREGEHYHLEGDDHGEYAEIIDDAADLGIDPRYVPRRHRGEYQDERRGQERYHKAVYYRLPEIVVSEGHTLDVVIKADVRVLVRKGEGLGLDEGILLEGVYDNGADRQDIDNADNGEND